ncbi:ABC transporter ATP-binding protein [bacterium SCSIO 12741]|nr:ABC transporter ATP-binding protein [bacterium SCSIO 12741]
MTREEKEQLLRVFGVHKKFEGDRVRWALKGISFDVFKGQHLFIIGETGSGKSTLLKCIYGLLAPDKGRVRMKGQRVRGPGEILIPGHHHMRLVSQGMDYNAYQPVRLNLESVLSPGYTVRERDQKVKEMLALVQLEKESNKMPVHLSGGQQQRLSLARSLIELPELLLMDEPFAHLDPQTKNRIYHYLNEQTRLHQTTIVTVTHDYHETLKNADEVVVLRKGKLIQQGSPQVLYNEPVDEYTAGLLGEFNSWEKRGTTQYIRPEHFVPDEQGPWSGKVTGIRYSGFYRELFVDYKGQKLTFFLPLGDEKEYSGTIRFTIKNKS